MEFRSDSHRLFCIIYHCTAYEKLLLVTFVLKGLKRHCMTYMKLICKTDRNAEQTVPKKESFAPKCQVFSVWNTHRGAYVVQDQPNNDTIIYTSFKMTLSASGMWRLCCVALTLCTKRGRAIRKHFNWFVKLYCHEWM